MKPRAALFLLLGLALGILVLTGTAHTDSLHPFAFINGTNTSIEYLYPLREGYLGTLEPCQEVIYSAHAELRFYHAGLNYEAAPVAIKLDQGPRSTIIAAGIDFEPYPRAVPVKFYVHLVIYTDDEKYADKTIGEVAWNQGGDWDAIIDIKYDPRGYVYVIASHGSKKVSIVVEASSDVKLYAVTHEGSHASSYVHREKLCDICQGTCEDDEPKKGQYGDPYKHNNDGGDDKTVLYAVAGLGALSLLMGLFALARPSGGVVVVKGSRGLVQLLGVLMLLAFLAGGYFAWKLGHHSSSGGSDKLVLALAAGFLLFLFLFLLMARRQTEVVVVEG